jgi:hypothetical protein
MLQYYVHDRIKDMIRLAVGLYKYSERVDGFLEQSLYWSSMSFEYIIRCTYGKESHRKELNEIILDMCSSLKGTRSERETLFQSLDTLRKIRNKMFHPEGSISDQEAKSLISHVCRIGGCEFDNLLKEITYEQVRQLRNRVFKIPRVLPDAKIPDQPDVCESDFDDLEVLYEKCKCLHYNRLRTYLSPLHLQPEEMSELIPTTGAIWLPWVLGQSGKRRHVRTIVLEARFSPERVRIGIDFGSEAFEAKAAYYNLISASKLDGHLAGLARKNYHFYDTYWYFHVRNVRPIRDCYPLSVEEIKSRIESALFEIETKRHRRILMKGHQLLIGKIFNRGSEEFNQFLIRIPETIKGIFSDLLPIVGLVEQSTKMSSIAMCARD